MYANIRYFLSSTKNYASTFRIRSRLGEFFKHVHPDQLNQASKTVKQQNLRSLTNLNSYIDSISQSKSIQSKLLKFYLAQKTNNKSKKFYSFSIELPEIRSESGQLSEQRAKKLIDNIVEVLNKKFKQSKNISNRVEKVILSHKEQKKEHPFDQPTESEKFNQLSQTAKPFNKRTLAQQEQNRLKSALNTKYMEAEKDNLSAQLKKQISFADTSTNKPMMWSRMAAQQTGLYKDLENIFESMIDPRLIYFDEKLNTQKIDVFKKKLLPGSINRQAYKNSKIILEICEKLESLNPPVCLYISQGYNATDIPGFLTIPYNFEAVQFAKKYEQLIDTVIAQQQRYEQYYDYYTEICATLKKNSEIVIEPYNFKNNNDIWMRILALKRIQKYDFRGLTPNKIKVILFDREQFQLFKENYKIRDSRTVVWFNSKIIAAIDYQEDDMQFINQRLRSISEC